MNQGNVQSNVQSVGHLERVQISSCSAQRTVSDGILDPLREFGLALLRVVLRDVGLRCAQRLSRLQPSTCGTILRSTLCGVSSYTQAGGMLLYRPKVCLASRV